MKKVKAMSDLWEPGHGFIEIAPAFVIPDDRFVDWLGANDIAETRPDWGYMAGNFAQFDDGTKTAFNRNGNMFVGDIHKAARRIPMTPLNMLHQKKHVFGTFVGTNIIDPRKMRAVDSLELPPDAAQDRALPPDKMPFPYIEALSAIWRYHFKEEWNALKQAHDQGACFFSMEAVADSLTCMTSGCCDTTYPYRGTRDPSYCDSLNQPRAKKALNNPWFVGGAAVIPPGRPGWANADITRMMTMAMEEHPEEAETIYEQIAESASHLEPKEWELIMAMVLAGVFDEEAPTLTQPDFDRIFRCIIDIEFDPTTRRRFARDQAAAEAADGSLVAAGLAVVAADSGRVLLLQRATDPSDPASGTWEFPGGKLEPGETPLEAAKREWGEELGCDVPDGQIVGSWTSPNGVYQAFVMLVASEADVKCNMDPEKRAVLNPDDPDGEDIEVAAWWDPSTLPGMPALRTEVAESTDWSQLSNTDQISQDDANYRPADSEQMCGSCCYFDSMSGSCELVAGSIDPNYVCDFFTPVPEGRDPKPIATGVSYS
jgi:8-oxo-dGTP pyrophosphatase MutT (NUDIX family)